jgi:hypothetical protein
MRILFALLTVLSCAAIGPPATAAVDSPEQEARALARAFVDRLKPQLKQALAEGGPGRAIEVCASAAPEIADSLSAESGWTVKRVSLKARNVSRALPDSWERSVLQQFDERQAAGEDPADINHGEVRNGRYRYLQAQGVEPICLVCHGQKVADAVQESLSVWYPDDMATGYSLGEVRGAISLAKPLGGEDR